MKTLVEVREQIDREPTLDLIFTFAELAFLEGNRLEERNPGLAVEMYVASALHSYGYLFDSRFDKHRNSYDPHFREACLFYNGSLEKILRLMGDGRSVNLFPERLYSVRGQGDSFNLRCVLRSERWNGNTFEPFKFASDYRIQGLQNEYRQYGLGVPLLAARKYGDFGDPAMKYASPDLCFPLTALLRFLPLDSRATFAGSTDIGTGTGVVTASPVVSRSSLQNGTHFSQMPYGSASMSLHAVIELYDPLEVSFATIAGNRVPLESDLTTPLAYWMAASPIQEAGALGFLRPELLLQPLSDFEEGGASSDGTSDGKKSSVTMTATDTVAKSVGKASKAGGRETLKGLYLMQPYEQGKIPVIFLHGLGSSPLTWMEMFNALRGERDLSANYQFFFYFYPTGQPFWVSAAQFRDDLAEFRRTFDPYGADLVFDDILLVGHSMGGLIAHMQTIDGGERFWKLAGKAPLENVLVRETPETREEVRKWFYFRANPSVSRVVSIATPFRGSNASNDFTQWLGRSAIKLPDTIGNVAKAATGLLEGENELLAENSLLKIKTSIDSLAADQPIFAAMDEARKERSGRSAPTTTLKPAAFLPEASVRSVRYHNIIGQIDGTPLMKKFFPPSDGVVRQSSARIEGVQSEILVECEHTTIQAHPQTILEVRRILHEHLQERKNAKNFSRGY